MSYGHIPVKDIMMEKNIYQELTKLRYRRGQDETTMSDIINDMLREYLHTYVLSRNMGHLLVSKDVVRAAVDAMTDEQIMDASTANVIRYREGAIIAHGRPSLAAYLSMIRAFAKANKFDMELSKNPDNDNQALIVSFRLGEKFTQLKTHTYRALLEEFADIQRIESTGASIYVEFRPKKGQVIQESQK